MAKTGMDGVRKIDGRRAARQIDHFSLRCQNIDRIDEETALERGQPFARIGHRILPFEDLPEPADPFVEGCVMAHHLLCFLVLPVRSDAVFGMPMHFPRADLHLERFAARPDHRRVERTVIVRLWLRDVVVEFVRDRRPQLMDDAERGVAILDRVDEDAHSANVVDRFDSARLAAHLVPDAVDVLGSAGDFRCHTRVLEILAKRGNDVVDEALAVEPPFVEMTRDFLVFDRLDRTEAQILELPLQLPYAQTVRERREDLDHIFRDLVPRRALDARQIAQRLRALGQLDQHDANVIDHREQHFAEVFGLMRCIVSAAGVGMRAD